MNKINLKFVDLIQGSEFSQKKNVFYVQNQYRPRQHYTLLKKIKKSSSKSNLYEIKINKSLDVDLHLKNSLQKMIDKVKQKKITMKRQYERDQKSIKFKTQSNIQQKDKHYRLLQLYKIKQLKKLSKSKQFNQLNIFDNLYVQSLFTDAPLRKGKTQQLSDVLRQKIQQEGIRRSKSNQKNHPFIDKQKIQQEKINEMPIFIHSGQILKRKRSLNKKINILKSKKQQLLKIPIKQLKVELNKKQ